MSNILKRQSPRERLRTEPDKASSELTDKEELILYSGFQSEREPVNYKEKYADVTAAVQNLYTDFKPFVMNEDMGDSLRKILNEEQDSDPLILIKFMKHTIKAIMRFREESALADTDSSTLTGRKNDTKLEPYLQKAENDIRQHIRIEQQLKILIETLQSKYDELEKENEDLKVSSKALLKEMKADNAKLAELVRNKDNEIAHLNKLLQEGAGDKSRNEIMNASGDLKLKSLIGRPSHRDANDTKRYFESELNSLNKQVQHLQKVLAMKLPTEEKLRLFEGELLSVKELSLKKIQLVESRLKIIASEGYYMPDFSGMHKERTFNESPSGMSDSRFHSIGHRYASETGIKPASAQGSRNQITGEPGAKNERGGTQSLKQISQTQILQKILNDRVREPEREKRTSGLRQSGDLMRSVVDLSHSREQQREANSGLYFKNMYRFDMYDNKSNERGKERDAQFRSFDHRAQSNSRASNRSGSARGKASGHSSLERMRTELTKGLQKVGDEGKIVPQGRGSLTKKKGSHSNLRGASASNNAATRKASHKMLDSYKLNGY